MSYGFQILTTDGLVNVADMRSASFVTQLRLTTVSGSVTVPTYQENSPANSTNLVYLRERDGKVTPTFTFDDATNVFSWEPDDNVQSDDRSSDFDAIFVRID